MRFTVPRSESYLALLPEGQFLSHVGSMARRMTPDLPKPPSVSKAEGRRRLSTLIARGEALLAQRPLKEGQEDVWSTACIETVAATFGEESSHINTFIGQIRVIFSQGQGYDQYAEKRDAERIQRRIGVLQTLIEQIDLEIGFETPPVITAFGMIFIHLSHGLQRLDTKRANSQIAWKRLSKRSTH